MSTPTDVKSALGQIALAMGLKAIERLTDELDPDVMLTRASEMVGGEIKNALMEILGDENSTWASNLIDRLYENLDDGEIIDKIAGPLAMAMVDYFKQETSDLIDAIIAEIDLDDLAEKIADRIAGRVQISEKG
ncbi:MAG: hypothetical protein ABIH84_01990 [bacterium]